VTSKYLVDIGKDGVWVDSVAVHGVARFLQRDIVIISNLESSANENSRQCKLQDGP